MNSNDLVPGFNEEKDDSLKISLERVEGVEGSILVPQRLHRHI